MRARALLEAETLKQGLRCDFRNSPNKVEARDVRFHVWGSDPCYLAMWAPDFRRLHPEIDGYPIGSAPATKDYNVTHAIRELISVTNSLWRTRLYYGITPEDEKNLWQQ